MALTKEAAPEGDVLDILMPDDSEEIVMGIAPEAMAQIIGRLTDMYPDPVSATVREIISNATDATKTLPEELRLPIEIVTPSTFNPVFSVRDHGCGMSLETIRKIQSQYGGTTKKLDFRAIGAYGLGAKAPLSYCNEFTVSTTHDGWTTDFRVSRKAIGNKTEILLHRETDLPNGTIVTIPVRSQDNSRFTKAIETYRKFAFDTEFIIDDVPNVKNESYIEFDKILLDEDDNVWGSAWVDRASLANIFTNACSGNANGTSVKYSLSGWLYNPPRDQNSITAGYGYGSSDPDFIVELKPGVVDFGSGRDEITENDRSFELNRKIADRIGVMNEYMIDNTLKVYREMEAIEASNFIAKIHSYIEIENDEVVFMDRKNSNGTVTIPKIRRKISDFSTNSGFNPISLVSNTHKKNIDAIAFYGNNNEFAALEIERKGLFPSINTWVPKDVKASRYYYRQRKTRISEVNEHLSSGVLATEPSESVTDFIAAAAFFNYDAQPTVVTGVTAENFKKITSMRLTIGSNVLTGRTVFFTREDSIDKEEFDLISPLLKSPIEFITAEELVTKAKDTRKAMREAEQPKTAKGESTVMMRRVVIEDTSTSNALDLIKTIANGNLEHCSKSIQEIIDENAILIMTNPTSGPIKNILIGAANSGFNFADRSVYVVQTNMYAEHYNALVDYEGVLFHKDWSYNCNAAYKIMARGGFDSTVLNSDVLKMTEQDVVWKYLYKRSRYSSNSFASIISPMFDDAAIQDALELTGFVPEDEYTLRWSNNPDIDFDLLTFRIGEEKAMIVENFRSFQKEVQQRQSIEDRLLDDISCSSLDLTDELVAPIVKRYVTRYTEYLENAKAKAESDKLEAEKATEDTQAA